MGSVNGLPFVQHQAITWSSADMLSIRPSGRKLSEISIHLHWFSFNFQMHFARKKISEFWCICQWSLFGRDKLSSTCSFNGLMHTRHQVITWTNVDQYVKHYMVSLIHNELTMIIITTMKTSTRKWFTILWPSDTIQHWDLGQQWFRLWLIAWPH